MSNRRTTLRGDVNDAVSAASSLAALPLFYDPRMVARNESFSPSAQKPAQVVASWRKLGVPLDERPVTPVTVDELARAHDRDFVEDVLACRRPNGFGNALPSVARSLPFTSGALLSAARHVLTAPAPVAIAPCSGFHHARHARVSGFCTFNGLMVAALALLAEGLAQRVGILDCDYHYGDGTDEILDALGVRDRVSHWTAGAVYGDRRRGVEFLLRGLPEGLASMAGCDVVLYQAGADPHIDDPLGGFLTTEQLRERDALVFRTLAAMGIPVVWDLAGGYQQKSDGSIPAVLEIHDNTLRACAEVYLAARSIS
jgi:acetoin utilization deacetylase AcuC-like enzyme